MTFIFQLSTFIFQLLFFAQTVRAALVFEAVSIGLAPCHHTEDKWSFKQASPYEKMGRTTRSSGQSAASPAKAAPAKKKAVAAKKKIAPAAAAPQGSVVVSIEACKQ